MSEPRKSGDGTPRDDVHADPTAESAPNIVPTSIEPLVEAVIQEHHEDATERGPDTADELFPTYDRDHEEASRLNPVQQFLGRQDDEADSDKQTVRVEIPARTIVKVIVSLVLIWVAIQVASIFLLLLIALIICLALLPLVRRLEDRGLPRGLAVLSVFAMLVGGVVGFFWLIVPPVISQTQNLVSNAPAYVENFDQVLDRYPWLDDQVNTLLGRESATTEPNANGTAADAETPAAVTPAVDVGTVRDGILQILSVGTSIIGGLANAFFVIVLSLYLLVEGERAWRYFARYMTPSLRYRFQRLGPQLTTVVSGYVVGQIIMSTLFGVYSYIVLFVFNVPEPLLIALFSAVAVAIPIIGVPVATIAAMGIALAVGWQTSLIVGAAFIVYQQLENYILLPRVYGNTLRVSALSILVGVLVGGQLLGVIGIILSLPLTASIPVIERVWREQIPDDIVALEDASVTREPTPTEIVEG